MRYSTTADLSRMGDFRHLRAWQQAVDLAVLSAKIAAKLPESERFALADQLRRASYSVVLNIAEGMSHAGTQRTRTT